MKYSLVALSLLITTDASAITEKFYVKPSIGFQIFDQDGSPAYNGSISYGYNLNKNFSTEVAFNFYRIEQSLNSGGNNSFQIGIKNSTFSTLWNQYYNFDTTSKITPYLMFGGGISSYCLGSSVNKASISQETGDIKFAALKAPQIKNSYFAYQLGTGLKLDAGDRISFDIGYRMINIKSPIYTFQQYYSGNTSTTYYDVKLKNKYSHSLMFGLAYSF